MHSIVALIIILFGLSFFGMAESDSTKTNGIGIGAGVIVKRDLLFASGGISFLLKNRYQVDLNYLQVTNIGITGFGFTTNFGLLIFNRGKNTVYVVNNMLYGQTNKNKVIIQGGYHGSGSVDGKTLTKFLQIAMGASFKRKLSELFFLQGSFGVGLNHINEYISYEQYIAKGVYRGTINQKHNKFQFDVIAGLSLIFKI